MVKTTILFLQCIKVAVSDTVDCDVKKLEIEVSKNRSSLHQGVSSRTKDRAGGGNEPGYEVV